MDSFASRLPRVDRISDRSTFSRLREHSARKARSGPLGFRYVEDSAADGLGVGFAIPRAVGSAVVRNRIRRRLRAIFAELADPGPDELTLQPGALLVMVRPGAATASFASLRASVHSALRSLASADTEKSTTTDRGPHS